MEAEGLGGSSSEMRAGTGGDSEKESARRQYEERVRKVEAQIAALEVAFREALSKAEEDESALRESNVSLGRAEEYRGARKDGARNLG